MPASAIAAFAGFGIEGTVDGLRLRIGSTAFVGEIAGPLPADARAFADAVPATTTIVVLGSAKGTRAVFALGDACRPGAREAIDALHAARLTTVLMSGDGARPTAAIARELGIGDVRAELSPAGKLEAIRALQANGAVVAMVGDGVNDAPGLARADVSISLGSATPIAQWKADVLVLSDDLPRVAEAIRHAKRTLAVIRQNLGWALAYNAVAIPAAALGFVTPLVAAVGMSLSSLVVVLNALRAARITPPRR